LSERYGKNIISCGECNSTKLLRDHEYGEIICQECGLVLSSTLINQGPERRAFDPIERDKRTRVGIPSTWTIHDKGLSTTIGRQNKDYLGRKLSPENSAKLYRLRKWHLRSKVNTSDQRNLAKALSEMNSICHKLHLPQNIIETSSINYRNALKKHLIRGRTIQSIVAACIYMACRQCEVTRSLEDIAKESNLTKKITAKNYRFLLKALKPRVPHAKASGYISNIINKLALSGEVELLALQILSKASELRLNCGRSPKGIAAACIYISAELIAEHRTQSEIATEAGVTEVTIRNRYKELITYLNIKVML
jgi:transcription initiation factor TFIIB